MSRPDAPPSADELRRDFDAGFAAPAAFVDAGHETFLALRIAAGAYLLRVLDIDGCEAARKIVPIPTATSSMLGLSAIRGALVPVYSADLLFGHSAAVAPPRWFLLCGRPDRVALAVGGLEGHVALPLAAIRPVDRASAGRRHIKGLVSAGAEIRAVIDVESLVSAVRDAVASTTLSKER